MQRLGHDARTNLKSNELYHPALAELLRGCLSRLTPAHLQRYPRYLDAAEAIASHFGCPADHLRLSPGSDQAIRSLCAGFATAHPGAPLLLQDPNYEAWLDAARVLPLEVRRFAAPNAEASVQAAALVEAASRARGALIAVTSPNGLSGSAIPDDRLDELCELARARDHCLVIDACYQAFGGPLDRHVGRHGEGVVVVQSLSKSHGLAGARLAVVLGEPGQLSTLLPASLERCVASWALVAATAMIEHHDELRVIWRSVANTRDRCAAALAHARLEVLPSSANFVAVRVGSARVAAAVAEGLSSRGYRIRELSALPGLRGCIRFTIADSATMEAFLDALLAEVHEARARWPEDGAPG